MTLKISVEGLNKVSYVESSSDTQVLCRNHLTPFPPGGALANLPVRSVLTNHNFSSVEASMNVHVMLILHAYKIIEVFKFF